MPALGPPGRAGPVGKNIAGQELSGVRSSRGWWSNLSVRVLILKSARNLPKPYWRGVRLPRPWGNSWPRFPARVRALPT